MPASPLTRRSQAHSAAHTRRHRDRAAMQQTINSRWSSYARNKLVTVLHWSHVDRFKGFRMRKAQIVWLGATMVAIGSLLISLQPRQERRDTTRLRVDEPGAAARSDLAHRQPTDGVLGMPRLYEAATRRAASLARFSSAI